MTRISNLSDESFARQTVRLHIDSFLGELHSLKRGMRQEWIHGTRVHSRRTRAALEAFEDLFPSGPWKALHEQVRQVTKQLGKLREREVSLTILRDLTSGGDMAENLCREYLEERLRRKQRRVRKHVAENIRKAAIPALRSQSGLLFGGPGGSPTARRARADVAGGAPGPRRAPRGPDAQPTLFDLRRQPVDRARRALGALAAPILVFQGSHRFRRATDHELHALRIATKKLRYAMELFDGVWPGGLRTQIAQARVLQDAIGHFHDLAVVDRRVAREIRRASRNDASHMAFQLGRMLTQIEERKASLRRAILPPLRELASTLRALAGAEAAAAPALAVRARR